MIRIGVIICFAVTLLCPVICLAGTDGECSAHASLGGENCEAMSIGAVVEEPGCRIASPDRSADALEGSLSFGPVALDHVRRLRWAARHRERAKPPDGAARRQALLQTFLF